MRFRAGAVVLLFVLTAGCSGIFGGGSQDVGTVTPAPVPTAPSTPEDPRVGVAPGVSATNVTDVGYLAERHVTVVESMRYRWIERYHERHRGDTVSYNRTESRTITHEDPTTYRLVSDAYKTRLSSQGSYLFDYGMYADGDTEYTTWRRTEVDGQRVFRRDPTPMGGSRLGGMSANAIQQYLALDSASVSRTEVGGAEGDHFLLTGNRSTIPRFGDVEDYRARAVVRHDGFVRRLNVTFNTTYQGHDVTVRYGYAYTDIGSANVTPPSWISAARAEFGDTSID